MKTFITALLIGTAALFGAAGVAHADTDPDVVAACDALMHQPKDAYVGPNHAVLNLVHDGMAYDRAEALVGQLAVYHTNTPQGGDPLRSALTCGTTASSTTVLKIRSGSSREPIRRHDEQTDCRAGTDRRCAVGRRNCPR